MGEGRAGIGVVGEVADLAHRQPLALAGHVHHQLAREHAPQALPRRASGEAEVGQQALLGLGHLVARPLLAALQGVGVVCSDAGSGGQLVRAEAAHPRVEPAPQAGQLGQLGLQLGLLARRGRVARVRRHERREVPADEANLVHQLVGRDHDRVERGERRVVDRLVVAAPHVVLVVERSEPGEAGTELLAGGGVLAGPDRREDIGDIPAREISGRHGPRLTGDAPCRSTRRGRRG